MAKGKSNQAVFSEIGKEHTNYVKFRRDIIEKANQALNKSKRAIFSMHRGEIKPAENKIKQADKLLADCEKRFTTMPGLKGEGSYQAALEEYAEAVLFHQFLKDGCFKKTDKRIMNQKTYIAAISDTTGEILRYAVSRATDEDYVAVAKAEETVQSVIEFMLELDLTGYLRQKFDQAKKNLRNLEQIRYEIKMRG